MKDLNDLKDLNNLKGSKDLKDLRIKRPKRLNRPKRLETQCLGEGGTQCLQWGGGCPMLTRGVGGAECKGREKVLNANERGGAIWQ